MLIFFFQAEDGIRDADVTGVQTCALPISVELLGRGPGLRPVIAGAASHCDREDGGDDPGQGESRRRQGCSPTSAERRTRDGARAFRSTPAPPARTLGLSPRTPALPPLCRRRRGRTGGPC